MKTELIYLSQSGNTEKLFYGIASQMKQETHLVNLDEAEPSNDSDLYIIGFGINSGTVPLKIMDILEDLNEKDFALIITCGLEATDEYKSSTERKLTPFFNDNCRYHGILLCQGEFPLAIQHIAEEKAKSEPDHPYAQKVLNDAKISNSHPNDEDIQSAIDFIEQMQIKKF